MNRSYIVITKYATKLSRNPVNKKKNKKTTTAFTLVISKQNYKSLFFFTSYFDIHVPLSLSLFIKEHY